MDILLKGKPIIKARLPLIEIMYMKIIIQFIPSVIFFFTKYTVDIIYQFTRKPNSVY